MKRKKFSIVFLLLVLLLQLLPVRQAVKYFWVDNLTTEEEIEVAKNLQQLDEAWKFIPDSGTLFLSFSTIESTSFLHFTEQLPLLYIEDIQTPPPNA